MIIFIWDSGASLVVEAGKDLLDLIAQYGLPSVKIEGFKNELSLEEKK